MHRTLARNLRDGTLAAHASRLGPNFILRRPTLFQAFLYLTHRCNLRCLYCNFPFQETPELSTEQWLGVIDQLAGFRQKILETLQLRKR